MNLNQYRLNLLKKKMIFLEIGLRTLIIDSSNTVSGLRRSIRESPRRRLRSLRAEHRAVRGGVRGAVPVRDRVQGGRRHQHGHAA